MGGPAGQLHSRCGMGLLVSAVMWGGVFGVAVGHATALCAETADEAATALDRTLAKMSAPYQEVLYSGEQNLRDFVALHLKDPDLWPTVLKINHLGSPADLSPGAVLQLPVQQVAYADQALAGSLQAIQNATAQGARLFAPKEIGSAIEDRDTAVAHREDGAWREVVRYAGTATEHATEAFEIAVAQRDKAAEALITDIHGDVEGRDPAAAAWSDRSLNDILVEFERLRTLTKSTTQVTFRDLSRLRLNPNSNATIQRMRSDPLTGREVTKVSLSSGDFYALLNQQSDHDSFEIDVPGLTTTTKSDDFWIKKDDKNALFVNYDTAALDIASGSDTVSIGQDQGVVITADGVTTRTDILAQVVVSDPAQGADLYGSSVTLNWQAFPKAVGYWFEVAADPGFNRMLATEWGVQGQSFQIEGLKPGAHYWRVAALDSLGLPGKWSAARDFELRIDVTPPFLTLFAPIEAAVVEVDSVELLGASENGVLLTLNDVVVPVAPDGSFLITVDLAAGDNALVLVAVDAAGNRSQKKRQVTYAPRNTTKITLAAELPRAGAVLLSRNAEMTIIAATTAQPGRDVILRNGAGAKVGQTRIDGQGNLTITVPVGDSESGFSLEVLSVGGAVSGLIEFAVRRDQDAPQVTLDVPPPRATSDDLLDLTGTVGDAVALRLSGKMLEIFDHSFATQVSLIEGKNTFEFQVEDAAGNVSVLLVETRLDMEPPQILDAEISRPNGANGAIEIVVTAQDVSGLRQAAPFLVAVGDAEIQGYLRCDSAGGICRASLPAASGDLHLIEVIVQDYAGNEAIHDG